MSVSPHSLKVMGVCRIAELASNPIFYQQEAVPAIAFIYQEKSDVQQCRICQIIGKGTYDTKNIGLPNISFAENKLHLREKQSNSVAACIVHTY
jgi:hypothetical protein